MRPIISCTTSKFQTFKANLKKKFKVSGRGLNVIVIKLDRSASQDSPSNSYNASGQRQVAKEIYIILPFCPLSRRGNFAIHTLPNGVLGVTYLIRCTDRKIKLFESCCVSIKRMPLRARIRTQGKEGRLATSTYRLGKL